MDKGEALLPRRRCLERKQRFLRFDHSGHGRSDGLFEDGTIGCWTEDAETVIEAWAPNSLVLVGSSTGGWIALLLARSWGMKRVRGFIGIAAAPDFTEDLISAELSAEDREALDREGVTYRPSAYGKPLPITARIAQRRSRTLTVTGAFDICRIS